MRSRSSASCGSRKPGLRRRMFAAGHGISTATFFKWKGKYRGLDVSEARRLKLLTDENAKLKKLLADAMLDNAMLKEFNSRKW